MAHSPPFESGSWTPALPGHLATTTCAAGEGLSGSLCGPDDDDYGGWLSTQDSLQHGRAGEVETIAGLWMLAWHGTTGRLRTNWHLSTFLPTDYCPSPRVVRYGYINLDDAPINFLFALSGFRL
ncbi:hypothetical protein EJ05DRAFT_502025 [Pseudovirgaria hyperparasitica]|uniref:Uncharacterized protein n=1 Tax=Pseudovirgaria hyperparasitica TaxID=470096 RepID=A0A6A6W310_9PEZI|nr:uncharacterized protein EJ05DRAFT_502025 [Pseudovirgaria hyperparasitica]KAF2756519.1 hypothetical protein EJ05DRAFT_502025 [Pseudovirgaria hyperparasitica]